MTSTPDWKRLATLHGLRFQHANGTRDDAIALLESPALTFLEYLSAKAEREPHNAAFLARVAGNVRKVENLA